ncbi:MAG: fructose-bisphosphate aldolase [Chloroflexi bacterium]|nr:fructose-bisphosphate aldolase [Chloroflexota bacterium]
MKELRLRRIFAKDGRAVIVACDHAGFMGVVQGLEQPETLIDALVESGVDAVLTTLGIARRFGSRMGKLGLILRVDGGATMRSPVQSPLQTIFSIEDACRLGADAVICMGMIGYPEEPSSLQNLTLLVGEAEKWGMPVVAEMLVRPAEGPCTAEDLAFAMRVGVELGADVIKASYAGPPQAYRAARRACYRPVVVLGGEKVNDEGEMLLAISNALEAGADGVAIGRNVWQHANPAGVCRALVALVHGGASVDQACRVIGALG